MELHIDELTALVFQHSRRAMQARKTAAELLKLADEDDRLAQVYKEAGKRFNRDVEAEESKMTIRRIISGMSVLVLMFALLSVGSLTLAQDVPDATENVTVTASVNGASVEATLEPTQPPTGEQPSGVIYFTWTALAGLISTVLTVGLAGGAGGAVMIIRAIRQNDTIKFAMEKLYLSASPDTQRLIRGGVEVAKEGVELADEITDGVVAAPAKA